MDDPDRFQRERALPLNWFNKSSDLRGAAAALWVSQSRSISDNVVAECGLPRGFSLSVAVPRVYKMLAGMSLELMYKATLVAAHRRVPPIHKLVDLAASAGVRANKRDKALLLILTDAIEWYGRYPVPKEPSVFRDFGERVQQHLFDLKPMGRLKIITPNGALGWDGFDALWQAASSRFWQIHKPG